MASWLLLLHQIPPKPPYFRAKVARRLAQVGALPIKNSAYLLPDTDDTREDFEWICREIQAEGGAAWLFEAKALAGLTEEQARAAFRQLRDSDYQQLLANARDMDDAKLALRFEQLAQIDFFHHPAREQVAALIEERRQRAASAAQAPLAYTGRTWVTRRGIKVDRIGSAWLVRRFIDPQARFHFVEPTQHVHAPGDQRFDMFEGEFTHEGDLCTFEVLVRRFGLLVQSPALQPLAEMVHDIDLKDARYGRPETIGLSRMLDGLCSRTQDDQARLEQGGPIFDALLASFEG